VPAVIEGKHSQRDAGAADSGQIPLAAAAISAAALSQQ
jgi:hypothetical protein